MRGTADFQVAPEQKWWSENTTAIVTGGRQRSIPIKIVEQYTSDTRSDSYASLCAANKGIGKAAAQLLAQNGLKTIVAARDG